MLWPDNPTKPPEVQVFTNPVDNSDPIQHPEPLPPVLPAGIFSDLAPKQNNSVPAWMKSSGYPLPPAQGEAISI